MLKPPQKIICPGQSVKFPLTQIEPIDWLIPPDAESPYSVFCIDYIVDKYKNIVALFQKLEYEGENENYEFQLSDLYRVYSKETILSILKFAHVLQSDYRLFIWKKDFGNEMNRIDTGEKKIIEVILIQYNDEIYIKRLRTISINELEKIIYSYRKFDFPVVKPLKTGTSYLGCYLSNNTRNPWPGDIDAVIFNKQNQRVEALIEFKTHNLGSPTIEEHIEKYDKQDWRRFAVLFALQKQLHQSTNKSPALIYIPWGTQNVKNHQQIKLDYLIDYKVFRTKIIDRPAFHLFSKMLFDAVLA